MPANKDKQATDKPINYTKTLNASINDIKKLLDKTGALFIINALHKYHFLGAYTSINEKMLSEEALSRIEDAIDKAEKAHIAECRRLMNEHQFFKADSMIDITVFSEAKYQDQLTNKLCAALEKFEKSFYKLISELNFAGAEEMLKNSDIEIYDKKQYATLSALLNIIAKVNMYLEDLSIAAATAILLDGFRNTPWRYIAESAIEKLIEQRVTELEEQLVELLSRQKQYKQAYILIKETYKLDEKNNLEFEDMIMSWLGDTVVELLKQYKFIEVSELIHTELKGYIPERHQMRLNKHYLNGLKTVGQKFNETLEAITTPGNPLNEEAFNAAEKLLSEYQLPNGLKLEFTLRLYTKKTADLYANKKLKDAADIIRGLCLPMILQSQLFKPLTQALQLINEQFTFLMQNHNYSDASKLINEEYQLSEELRTSYNIKIQQAQKLTQQETNGDSNANDADNDCTADNDNDTDDNECSDDANKESDDDDKKNQWVHVKPLTSIFWKKYKQENPTGATAAPATPSYK